MVFIYITAAILLLGIAFWLWRLRRTRKIDLEVETELVSTQEPQSTTYSPPGYSSYPISGPYSPASGYPYSPPGYASSGPYSPPSSYPIPMVAAPKKGRGLGLVFGALLLLVGGIIAGAVFALRSPAVRSAVLSVLWITGLVILGIIVLVVLCVAASRLYRFLKAKQQQGRVLVRGVVGLTASYRRAQYIGRLIFPQQVYEGNSESISVTFQKGHWTPKSSEALSSQSLPSQEQIALHIRKEGDAAEQLLEAELLAAGLTVDGSKQQRQPLGGFLLSYRWNCYFPHSGKHIFTLILRVVSPTGAMELETIERSIKVTKFAGLTQRQVGMAAGVAGVAGFVLTIVSIFSTLHIFGL